ncbi:MAG: transposase [Halobacteriovoraceae bacterium]|nr:transposase [Halobacteriovoraceae bacterium]MCB9095368.1 transposase [Halobacteriovoraceae bacterium]
MPRKTLIRTNLYYYHVNTRSNNRAWFKLPLEEVWEICRHSFAKAQKNNPALISQFVLMSNHYHLLIKTPQSDIDKFMFWFNKTFSDELRARTDSINRMFGSSYKWSIVFEEYYLRLVYRYIYQNPLRVSLVQKCEDYPFSTLYYQHRGLDPGFPFHPEISYDDHLSINNELCEDDINIVRDGLKKTKFKPKSQRKY